MHSADVVGGVLLDLAVHFLAHPLASFLDSHLPARCEKRAGARLEPWSRVLSLVARPPCSIPPILTSARSCLGLCDRCVRDAQAERRTAAPRRSRATQPPAAGPGPDHLDARQFEAFLSSSPVSGRPTLRLPTSPPTPQAPARRLYNPAVADLAAYPRGGTTTRRLRRRRCWPGRSSVSPGGWRHRKVSASKIDGYPRKRLAAGPPRLE
jgi:hypothetical protein